MSVMPVKFKVSVVQVGTSLKVTIPKELAEHIQVLKGDEIIMFATNSHIEMYKNIEKKGA